MNQPQQAGARILGSDGKPIPPESGVSHIVTPSGEIVCPDGAVVLPELETPEQFDQQVMDAVAQAGRHVATLAIWYGRRGDLAVMPGDQALDVVADVAFHAAVLLRARAQHIRDNPPDRREQRQASPTSPPPQ